MSEQNGLATAEQVMAAARKKRRFKNHTLPISGLKMRMRSLTEGEISRYQSVTVANSGVGLKRSKLEDASLRLIVLCLVDGDGNQLLKDNAVTDLTGWDHADSGSLYEECAKHCGINRSDIEDLVKNSEQMADVSVLSDSPSE